MPKTNNETYKALKRAVKLLDPYVSAVAYRHKKYSESKWPSAYCIWQEEKELAKTLRDIKEQFASLTPKDLAVLLMTPDNKLLQTVHKVPKQLRKDMEQPWFARCVDSDGFVHGWRTYEGQWAMPKRTYDVGIYIEEDFDPDPTLQCGSGLHFCLDKSSPMLKNRQVVPVLVPVEDVLYIERDGKCRARTLIVTEEPRW